MNLRHVSMEFVCGCSLHIKQYEPLSLNEKEIELRRRAVTLTDPIINIGDNILYNIRILQEPFGESEHDEDIYCFYEDRPTIKINDDGKVRVVSTTLYLSKSFNSLSDIEKTFVLRKIEAFFMLYDIDIEAMNDNNIKYNIINDRIAYKMLSELEREEFVSSIYSVYEKLYNTERLVVPKHIQERFLELLKVNIKK